MIVDIGGQRFRKLEALLYPLEDEEREALLRVLNGRASAERIAGVLIRRGHPISASTIRTYRRLRRQAEENKHDALDD